MLLEQALQQTTDLTKPLRVLDACAAPGGKSTHLLSLLHRDSLVVANEAIRGRVSVLSENISKWGYPNALVAHNDPHHFQRLPEFFDVILVDAPCSGEGLFRKDPDAAQEWSPDAAQLCAQRQQRILLDLWPTLKPGGILIYSTCTYNPTENIDHILHHVQSSDAESCQLSLPQPWGVEKISAQNAFGYQCYPHRVKGEGFFFAVMRKLSGDEFRPGRKRELFERASKRTTEELSDWLMKDSENVFIQHREMVTALPAALANDIELVSSQINIVRHGTAVARLAHNKAIPEHDLAMSTLLNREAFHALPVNLTDAIAYLRKENIHLPSDYTGFHLVTYEDVPLGWINRLPQRSNNLYPSEWRVRTQSPINL